jgi:hypothetical protein
MENCHRDGLYGNEVNSSSFWPERDYEIKTMEFFREGSNVGEIQLCHPPSTVSVSPPIKSENTSTCVSRKELEQWRWRG